MSRHNKTFAPRANRSEAQTTDNKEEQEKYIPISSQDAKISLAKTEVTQITYGPFKNRAFNKVERGSSIIKFPNNGLHVLVLNMALNELGYQAPENETFFGDKTKKALMSFQSDYGIQKSGILDRETLLKMDRALGKLKDKKTKKDNDDIALSAALEKPKTTNSKDDDSVIYTIVVAKNQKFNGKLIQTDEDLNHFAEQKMILTRHLNWNPKFTDEQVKNIVTKGGSVNYRISAKEHTIEKEAEALSPDKKQFIRDAANAADYIQNTRILDLLKQLSEEEIADYKSKVSNETNDLTAIEESLKEYIKNRNNRDKEKNNREKLQQKLGVAGLEALYKQYSNYIKFKHNHENIPYEPKDPNKIYFQNALNKKLEELLVSLNVNGFTLESFKKLITDYELSFRKETVHIAEDSLIKYRHVLFEQKKKLLNDTFIKNILEKIEASKARESYEVANSAGTPIILEKPNSEERAFKNKMDALARSKRAEGNAAIKELASTTPLVEDNGFDKEGFAQIETQQELRNFLEDYINDQEGNITKIIAKLQSDQGLSIYGFVSLLQKSKEQQGIAKDSIFDLIITDKEDEESTKHIIEGLLIGVLAVALGLLSFGTGTVAVLLAAGNFALGAYLTYEEIESYRTQLAAYKVDISDDEPSAVWVIIGVVGSVLDAAAVAKISKTLVKAGRMFEETKDISQTKKVLEEAKLDPETEKKVIKALEEEKAKPTTPKKAKSEQVEEKIEIKEKVKTEGIEETQLTNMGRNIPPLTSEELARVLEWQDIRNKFLKEWREKDFSTFVPDLQNRLKKVTNSIRKNLTPDDIAAVIKEKRGVQILKLDGTPFNHLEENEQAIDSIVKTIKELKTQMNRDIGNHIKCETLIGDLSNLKDEMIKIIK